MKEQPRSNHNWTDKEVLMVLADAPMDFNAAKHMQRLGCKHAAVARIYPDALAIAGGALRKDPSLRNDPYIQRIERAMRKLKWFSAVTIHPYSNDNLAEREYDRLFPGSKVSAKHKHDYMRKLDSEGTMQLVKMA